MRQLVMGILIGSALTATVGIAGSLYDSRGNPKAPTGSIEQFDYFRQRQLFLDVQAQRRAAEQQRLNQLTHPCGK